MIKITKGLDLPINGKPEQVLSDVQQNISTVAITGPDYHGCKPTMSVKVGDQVKLGQLLFSDKKVEGAKFTSPAAGTVTAINRGERRVLESVVISVDANLEATPEGAVSFTQYNDNQITDLDRATVIDHLSESGLWTSLRTRPYSKTPAVTSEAQALFVTVTDTNPLAADPMLFINKHKESFKTGLLVLSKLAPKTFVCAATDSLEVPAVDGLSLQTFQGKHPAGNVGTHIHMLCPVSQEKPVWHIGYQDVVAIGSLFSTGTVFTERMVSIAGPMAAKPQVVTTRVGANVAELTNGLLQEGNIRVISGSVWNGRTVQGSLCFLGKFHNQITALGEGDERKFMGWLTPGVNKYSVLNIFLSAFARKTKTFDFTATTNGSERAMVPLGQYEAMMPLDILPTQLLRALLVEDIVKAMELGCLELDEEDLALCTFACAGKYEYGPILRDNLTRIEKET